MNPISVRTFAAALLASSCLVTVAVRAEVPTQFVNAQTGTTYTVVQTDCSKLVTFSNASAVAVTLPQAGTSGKFFGGCFIDFQNKGAGLVTITPSTSTVNGAATLVLATNQGSHVVSDGTNYQIESGAGIGAGAAPCTASATATPTCNGLRGVVTTITQSNAFQTATSVIISNSFVTSTSVILCTMGTYSGTILTNGLPLIEKCVPGTGVITTTIYNTYSTALAGTVDIQFGVLK